MKTCIVVKKLHYGGRLNISIEETRLFDDCPPAFEWLLEYEYEISD